MQKIQMVSSEESVKLLGDQTRLYILRRLISEPLKISQIGDELGKHAAMIRQHVIKLQNAGLIELCETRINSNYIEKFYRASASAFFVNLAIFPQTKTNKPELVLGSDDPGLSLLAQALEERWGVPLLHIIPVGSLDGLIYMRSGYCRASGCHLQNFRTGDYNISTIKMLFSADYPLLIHLYSREQGLMVQRGNPLQIQSIESFKRSDVRIVNRITGSGTRHWLEHQMRLHGIEAQHVKGYTHCVSSHIEAGNIVLKGGADTAVGLRCIAERLGLDFIPLYQEKYQLAVRRDFYESETTNKILEMLVDETYRIRVSKFGGYDLSGSGEIIEIYAS